ncbi:universal stress protein [Spongiactinospora rosea]|uniref:Universal stress protein n=1 Tax=Spongiactinospora rosea TaxID=2248750 RepID=A0A366LQ13_9ACTN|nr:universal stress protein [Spongiactinospora rosea]RBQ15917.1 universal stress protein [Spongiactinospora rosea]
MIIAGVDGSRAGLEAAGWAAREAALRAAPLKIVHAIPQWACDTTTTGRYGEIAAWMREGGYSVLAAAADRARRERPEIDLSTSLLPGDPRTALTAASEEAELVVIGGHGLGAVRGLLVGSVAYGVAGHAACDVVVVRELPALPRDEVVAGIDGSTTAGPVLEAAFTEAGLRGATLRAVHARNQPWIGDPRAPSGTGPLPMAGHRDRHPDVTVIQEIVHDHPVRALRQAATGADLLVVGSRGHGTFAGMVMGSVSQALLHESPCPLMVVHRTPGQAP